jgi:tRNA pseudouridine38-40 synthase
VVRRIKLAVEYDGTSFLGFQRQRSGDRTVQRSLEEALAKIAGHRVVVVGAGRTDAGVHALGQVVHFDLNGSIPTDRIAVAVNSNLPDDLSVRSAEEVGVEFHARFSAKKRTYLYFIFQRQNRSAVFSRYSWHLAQPLDTGAMRDASASIVGVRDFASLANAGGDPGSTTVRHLYRLDIRDFPDKDIIAIRVTANGFLRSMVRNLVGALADIGSHKVDCAEFSEIVQQARRQSNPCKAAPANGLVLWRVDY